MSSASDTWATTSSQEAATSTTRSGSACASPRPAPTTRSDRKSTRLNSSHLGISYAVFCLKKKKKQTKGRDARAVDVALIYDILRILLNDNLSDVLAYRHLGDRDTDVVCKQGYLVPRHPYD